MFVGVVDVVVVCEAGVDDATGVSVPLGASVEAIAESPNVDVGAKEAAGGDQKIVVTAVFALVATTSSTGVLAMLTCACSLATLIIGRAPAPAASCGEPIWAETEMS